MKKIIILALVLATALTACDGFNSQSQDPAAVPPTAEVVVVTVEVTAPPGQAPPTPLSFTAPLPTLTPVPPTQAVAAPVELSPVPAVAAPIEPSPAPGVQPATSGPIMIDASMNGGVFENMSVSGDKFSLRCAPKEILFDLYTTDVYITIVELYYRVRDKHSNFVPGWARGATFETDGGNHFWLTFSGENVKADNRKEFGWFDFEFVGVNKYGDVVGRSKKIEGLVSYSIDCP